MKITFVPSLNLSGFSGASGEPELDVLIPPLGALTLAAVVQRDGHQAAIVDLNFEVAQRGLGLDRAFHDEAAARILATQPEVVGFSTMCNSFHIALRVAESLRARAPHIVTLFGGPHVSYCDEETLACFAQVDFVLRGEAEDTLPHFLAALSGDRRYEEVAGLTYRSRDLVLRNPPTPAPPILDELPFPAWEAFPYDLNGGFAIDVGRGCPFACEFCSTSVFFQRKFRLKSFERILAEAAWLQERFGTKAITLVHDLFTANRKWVHKFCDHLIAHREQISFLWSASARIDTVDEVLLKAMHMAGCRALFFGVETGSQRLQAVIGKRLKIETVYPVAVASAKIGIEPTLSFIAGFPQEQEEDLAATFALISRLLPLEGVGVQLHLMSPQVGTPDLSRYRDQLKFDSYFSDIAAGASIFLEEEWFVEHPDIFASFYFFDNPRLGRSLIAGADIFVRFVCNNMLATVMELTERASLWSVYVKWREWCDAHNRGAVGRAGSQYDSAFGIEGANGASFTSARVAPDELLLAFMDFVTETYGNSFADQMSDEILAFYIRYYHKKGVFEAPIPADREIEQGEETWQP